MTQSVFIYMKTFLIFIYILLRIPEIAAKPYAATTATTPFPIHIVSYVNQSKLKNQVEEYREFDFRHITHTNSKEIVNKIIEGAKRQQLIGRLEQRPEIDISNFDRMNNNSTDDSTLLEQNTLYESNDTVVENEQHESLQSGANNMDWNRIERQGIPVLEPVKHLLNTVRDGGLNHTSSKHHHLLGEHAAHSNATESAAIETEEDRETVIESTSFNFLELLGTIGGLAWNFLMNIHKLFAASSGAASASLSGSSSGGQ